MLEAAGGEAEERIDLAHPERVATGEVVVDGDDVDALASKCVEVDGKGGDERLALAGLHLGDLAIVEGSAADELDVEVAQADGAPRGLPHDGERLIAEVIERFAAGDALAEGGGSGGELVVGEGGQAAFEVSDDIDHALVALDFLVVRVAEDVEQFAEHVMDGLPCSF